MSRRWAFPTLRITLPALPRRLMWRRDIVERVLHSIVWNSPHSDSDLSNIATVHGGNLNVLLARVFQKQRVAYWTATNDAWSYADASADTKRERSAAPLQFDIPLMFEPSMDDCAAPMPLRAPRVTICTHEAHHGGTERLAVAHRIVVYTSALSELIDENSFDDDDSETACQILSGLRDLPLAMSMQTTWFEQTTTADGFRPPPVPDDDDEKAPSKPPSGDGTTPHVFKRILLQAGDRTLAETAADVAASNEQWRRFAGIDRPDNWYLLTWDVSGLPRAGNGDASSSSSSSDGSDSAAAAADQLRLFNLDAYEEKHNTGLSVIFDGMGAADPSYSGEDVHLLEGEVLLTACAILFEKYNHTYSCVY